MIDHTTSTPNLAIKIAEIPGIKAVDAPVSGGDVGAKGGCLVTMIGGTEEALEAALPLMNCYSANCQHMGGPGAGQHTKMSNQIMVAANMFGLCEALLYAQKAGLNHE